MRWLSLSYISGHSSCLLRICLGCLAFFVLNNVAFAAQPGFSLQSVQGSVEMQLGGKGDWTRVRQGVREASVGDHIRTGANGSIRIVTDDGSQIVMGPKTEIVLREPDQPKGWRVVIGRVMASFLGSHRLEVRAPGAIAAVEGTVFQLDVAGDGTSTLTVVEGIVHFSNEHGGVTVLASQQSTAHVGQPPSRPIVVDPSSLTAWEANVQTLMISPEYPLVSTDHKQLELELTRRKDLVNSRSQDPLAHAALAEVLIDLNQTDEAMVHAQRAAELASGQQSYHGLLGFALLKDGRPEEADKRFSEAISADLNDVRWQIGSALVALGQRDAEQAVKLIQNLATSHPDNVFLWTYLSAANLRSGDLEAANTSIAKAISIDPGNYLANTYSSYVQLAQGKMDDSVLAARRAVELAPESALAHEALGSVLTFSGQFSAARGELDRALKLNPLSSGSHLALAKLLAADGNLEEALQEAQLSVGLNPGSAPARSTLGLLFLLNKDPARAGREFKKALACDPSLSEARTGWGKVLFQTGRFREAVEQQKLAVSLDTDSASAENNLGGVYAAMGQMELAHEHLKHAIELQPGWGMPYANLALLYLEQNRFREALDAGELAVRLGERSAFAHTVLARIYSRQGRTDRAFSELRQAVALDERYPQAHFQLANLYLEQDRSRDAVREILNSVTADPAAMLETRTYARTENTLAAGSYDRLRYDARHSNQAADGRVSYFVSGLLDEDDGFRSVNQDTSEKFAEIIVGHQSRPTQQLVFFSTLFNRKGGLPGPETDDSMGDADDRQRFAGGDGVIAYRQKLSSRVIGTLKYSLRRSSFVFNNPDSLTGEGDNPFLETRNRSSQQSPEIRLDAVTGRTSSLSLGYTWLSDRIRQSGVARTFDLDTGEYVPTSFAEPSTVGTDTAWLEVKTSPNDRFHLTLGGYWGREEGTSSTLSPKIVALYRPDRSTWWSFAVSPIFRSDASELAPVEALADPKGLSFLNFAEAGFGHSYELRYQRQGGRSSALTASIAYQQVRDLLLDVEDPAFTGLPTRVLIDRGHRWMADTSYEQWLNDYVTGRAWLRWQSSRGRFPGEFVSGTEWPYAPKWQAGGRLDYINADGLRVGIEAVAVDKRFDDPENSQSVGGYLVFNLRFQYQRNLHQNYFLNVLNLADKDYESFAGFPQSGRILLFGSEYRF